MSLLSLWLETWVLVDFAHTLTALISSDGINTCGRWLDDSEGIRTLEEVGFGEESEVEDTDKITAMMVKELKIEGQAEDQANFSSLERVLQACVPFCFKSTQSGLPRATHC